MFRLLYVLGSAFVYVCVVAVIGYRAPADVSPHYGATIVSSTTGGDGRAWFAEMKPYCNALEVETRQQYTPPPSTLDGAGFSAACYALAGKIDRARSAIESRQSDERARAAGIVFEIGHPVADAGDDQSAGPIMALVLEFWPQNYMAAYHAGMSAYILGQHDLAREHLGNFLRMYTADDGWTRNAREVLGRLGT